MKALEIAVKALERIVENDSQDQSATKTARNALADIAAQQIVRDMDEVAIEYAHSMALELECILYEYSGQWYDRAIATLGKYREAMKAIHERESPTHMGEPFLPKDQPAWIRDAKPPVAQDIECEPAAQPCIYCGSTTSVCDQSIAHPPKHGQGAT